MPAVVRGGRRQAGPAPSSKAAPRAAASPKGQARGKGKVAAASKYHAIGSIAMPGEVTAWFAVITVVALAGVVLFTGHRAEALGRAMTGFADSAIGRLGLNVQEVQLAGVAKTDPAWKDVAAAVPVERGQPLALMDLEQVQKAVENVGWVRQASIRRQFPDTLIVSVTLRPRQAVWQYKGRDAVIDDEGHVIPEARAGQFLDLPLVVGEGANEQSGELLQLMQTRGALMQKTFAFVRVATRRWDIHLKNGTVIKLPALNQEQALQRLDVLIDRQRVLDQGFAEIDLLDPESLMVTPLEARTSASVAAN